MTPDELSKLRERLAEENEKMAKPINYDELIEKGLISKVGAWYRVNDIRRLPEHVSAKITETFQDQKGIKVKFRK